MTTFFVWRIDCPIELNFRSQITHLECSLSGETVDHKYPHRLILKTVSHIWLVMPFGKGPLRRSPRILWLIVIEYVAVP
ncbi:MAG: hypothetical protein Ct9H300mP19_04780 [Dehalococcoidia bacterium]|nr:MAG: hypothetical protein Ct9H300mP19_04780 [Dehalococcoidia bacterium]